MAAAALTRPRCCWVASGVGCAGWRMAGVRRWPCEPDRGWGSGWGWGWGWGYCVLARRRPCAAHS
eukprot:1045714-Prymnesium_polylepis.1